MIMENLHTLSLIKDAYEKVQELNFERYINELDKVSLYVKNRAFNQVLEKLGLHLMRKSSYEALKYSPMGKWSSVGTMKLVIEEPEKFDKIYNFFEDGNSKSTFDWFIKYRVAYALIGSLANKIFPSCISEEEFKNSLRSLRIDKQGFINIDKFSFRGDLTAVGETWLLEQYYHEMCRLSAGDIVIDGGAFLGETSFWFISRGASKVYAFEPDEMSFQVLSQNVARNKLENSVITIKKCLADENGLLQMKMNGSGSSSSIIGGGTEVEGVTLDSFVERNKLKRIDFIKLDVEGAEINVLKGATETIKKFKPKMAVSVYHKPEDIIAIPEFLNNLLPGSKFYLSHKFYDWSGTILFVNPRE